MSSMYLQKFIDKTRRYKKSLFCLTASCGYLLAGQPQDAAAAPRNQEAPKRPLDASKLARINEMFANCDPSKSLFDRMVEKRTADYTPFAPVDNRAVFVGTDNCPGTNIPAGTAFADADTTLGATNTVNQVNTPCGTITFGLQGPDKIYKLVLPAVGSRIPTCTATVTPAAGYDAAIYMLSQGGGGCPGGLNNSVTNCVTGDDNAFPGFGVAEQITDAQLDALPAGIYYLFIDSFYCGSDGSGCGTNECSLAQPNCHRGSYTLNFNCTTLAPTAALAGVGGRVTTADGRGIPKATVAVTLPSGQSRTVITNPFGFYNFEDIEVGQAYVFQVKSKGHTFSNSSQLITVNETIENLNFTADAQGKSR